MWGVLHLCRCTQSLRAAQGKLSLSQVSGMRNSFNSTSLVSRQLITQTKHSKANSWKGLRLSEKIKSNGLLVRFCSSAPKPKRSKLVGYWLLGCSGMVFTAVVLGMIAGYIILLYSIYYVIHLVMKTTKDK